MRINTINNTQFTKNSFGQLKIGDKNNWDADYLHDFVHNIEVLKFVKYCDDQGIDVYADGHDKSGIGLYGKNKNNEDKFFYGIYGPKEVLKDFDAIKVINSIAKTTQEKLRNISKIKEAEKFVNMFNEILKSHSASTVSDVDVIQTRMISEKNSQ